MKPDIDIEPGHAGFELTSEQKVTMFTAVLAALVSNVDDWALEPDEDGLAAEDAAIVTRAACIVGDAYDYIAEAGL